MINTNRPKAISADIVSECVMDLKNSNKNLKTVELYYQQGKIYANIYFEKELSLDKSKIVIRSLKDFIQKDNVRKYLSESYMPDIPIHVVIHSKDNLYYYQCPYYLRTNENSGSGEKSDYKIWYLTDSDGKTIEKINID